MSAVQYVFPKLQLAKQLRTPGGLPVVEAIAQAEANLRSLRSSCHAELLALLEFAEAASARLRADAEDAVMSEIYGAAARGIGAGRVSGAPGVDEALDSLCDLIDRLSSSGRRDREAILVHIHSWRLLMNTGLPQASQDEVLSGLRKISARYAA